MPKRGGSSSSSSSSSSKFRVGSCSRLLVAAALFWLAMQLALVPKGQGSHSSVALRQAASSSGSGSGSSVPPHRKILYVHIGKTGGEWIKSQLAVICQTRKNPKLKQACLDSFTATKKSSSAAAAAASPTFINTQISSQTVGYLHVHNLYPRNGLALATHFLFSVRHPLTRLASWYIYNHPQSCDPREGNSPSCKTTTNSEWKDQFYQCFPAFQDIALLGDGGEHEHEHEQHCSRVLWNGWHGRQMPNVKEPNHLYWNYQFYWNQTLAKSPHKPILVVRQEHLVSDMNHLEGFLSAGNNNPPTATTKATTTTTTTKAVQWRPADSTHFVTGRVGVVVPSLDLAIRQKLCCFLRDELQIYQTLIERAENLSTEDKQETIQTAFQLCGVMGKQAQQSWDELGCRSSSSSST